MVLALVKEYEEEEIVHDYLGKVSRRERREGFLCLKWNQSLCSTLRLWWIIQKHECTDDAAYERARAYNAHLKKACVMDRILESVRIQGERGNMDDTSVVKERDDAGGPGI